MPAPSTEATDAKNPAAPENVPSESTEMTQEQLLNSFHLMVASSEDLPILWNAISHYESMRALEITDLKKWKEPCQRELYKVLDRLAREQQKAGDKLYKFYLPNCNKNGFYHSKQCETSLEGEPGLCWTRSEGLDRTFPSGAGSGAELGKVAFPPHIAKHRRASLCWVDPGKRLPRQQQGLYPAEWRAPATHFCVCLGGGCCGRTVLGVTGLGQQGPRLELLGLQRRKQGKSESSDQSAHLRLSGEFR
ncbi:hypothetical protein CB1_000255001 [Camelus ferus]|nr:hypothetical protein CB1_000255001 [Camelus ferus]